MKKNILLFSALILLVCEIYSQNSKLTAYFPLNGNFNDATGNGHNCIENNLSYASDRNGNAIGACNFGGSSSFARVNAASNLSFSSNDSFSVTFWMKPFSTTFPYTTIISNCEQSDTSGYAIGFDDSGKLRVISNLKYPVFSSIQIPVNQWQHVGVTYANKTIKIYLNGSLNAIGFVPNLNKNTNGVIIGRLYNSLSNNTYFNGLLDEMKIYSKTLSDADISAVFSTGLNNQNIPFKPVSIFPSLIHDKISIKFESSDYTIASIQLINALGELVFSDETSQLSEICTSNFNGGVYYIRINLLKEGVLYQQIEKVIKY